MLAIGLKAKSVNYVDYLPRLHEKKNHAASSSEAPMSLLIQALKTGWIPKAGTSMSPAHTGLGLKPNIGVLVFEEIERLIRQNFFFRWLICRKCLSAIL